jgi:hypothetical protein
MGLSACVSLPHRLLANFSRGGTLTRFLRFDLKCCADGGTTMKIYLCAFVAVSIAAGPALAGEVASQHYSKAVQQACASDYKALCGEYGLDTTALRACMDRAGQKLSNGCVHALVSSGEVSQAEVNSRKNSGR